MDCVLCLLSFCGLLSLVSAFSAVKGPEYCQRESFNASCPLNQVIVMEDARYGRMHPGRCIQDVQIGCFTQVLEFMDQRCSGKRKCNVPVRLLMDHANPCSDDYTSFLLASYSCVKVFSVEAIGSNDECATNSRVSIHGQLGYLQPPTFALSQNSAIGKPQCPYHIRVDPAQRIKLTLLDFHQMSVEQQYSPDCTLHLDISEGLRSVHSFELCDQKGRERPLLTTHGSEVSISFVSSALRFPLQAQFLIKYEADGCRQLVVGDEFYVRQDERDIASVKCNATDETWYLTCKDNHWIGEIGNCTEEGSLWKERQGQGDGAAFPYGILIAVIVGILLGILIGSLLLALVYGCFKRRRRQDAGTADTMDSAVRFTPTTSEPMYPSLLKPSGQPNTLDYSAYGYYPEPPASTVVVGGQQTSGPGAKMDITAKLLTDPPRRHDPMYDSASLPGFARFAVASSPCPGVAVPCTALGTLHQHRRCPEYYELETEEKGRTKQLLNHDCRSHVADSPKK